MSCSIVVVKRVAIKITLLSSTYLIAITDGLDTSAAVTTVTQKVVELHRKKSQFKDIWLTWKYKNGVTQETSMQINTLKKTINAVSS